MMPRCLGLVAILIALPISRQIPAAPDAKSPHFDVVSIKISPTDATQGHWDDRCSSGRWTATNIPVAFLIMAAYGVVQSQVEGVPAWNNSPLHQFDITATCPEGTTDSQLGPMLQAMLADRFGFKAHFETREMPARALELAKNGPKMKPSTGSCVNAPSAPILPDGEHRCGQFYHSMVSPKGGPTEGLPLVFHFQAWSATTADFVEFFAPLGPVGQPPMVDDTGLTGKYDFDFHYEVVLGLKDAQGHPVDQEYEFIRAVKDQLGLTYNIKKMPIRVLVVDHISMPTPN